MEVQVLYFDGCPSWRTARRRLGEALAQMGRTDVPVGLAMIQTEAGARASGFAGSPTILVDGRDLFPGSPTTRRPDGLTCRLYATPSGMAGSPTFEDLVNALEERAAS